MRRLGSHLAALLIWAGSIPAWAGGAASSCGLLEDWLKARQAGAAGFAQIQALSEHLTVIEPGERTRAAERVYEAYFAGELGPGLLSSECLRPGAARDAFVATLGRVFFDRTLARFLSAPNAELRALGQAIERKLAKTELPLYSVRGGDSGTSSNNHPKKRAGFHRGDRNVFMSLDEIKSQEWNLIFVHEMAHWLDPDLESAIVEYADSARVAEVFAAAKEHSNVGGLSTRERASLRTFLLAGLDRGLLAEHRAWLATLDAYEDGIREGLWKRIPWVDSLLAQRKRGESLGHFVFRYLDPRFHDPAPEGIFSLPIVREELGLIRAELRELKDGPAGLVFYR